MPSETPDDHPAWADVHVEMEPEPTLSYRTAMTVYEESFVRGQFVGRGWNGAGCLSFYGDVRIDPLKHAAPQAFWVELDGQLLANHWEWGGYETVTTEQGLEVIVTLRPVTVIVHTLLDGTPVLTRWLEITNTGSRPAALNAAYSWSGVLQQTNRWRAHLPDKDSPLYSVDYMIDTHWGDEGSFGWRPLPNAGYRIDRRDRHHHPLFVLENHATGEHFIGQLAWSGGYAFEFDLDADFGTGDGAARLFFRAGPDAPAPQRVIVPNETVATPQMHLGMLFGDLNPASRRCTTICGGACLCPSRAATAAGSRPASGQSPRSLSTKCCTRSTEPARRAARCSLSTPAGTPRHTATGGTPSATGRSTSSGFRRASSRFATART